MCGIIGYIGDKDVKEVLIKGLKKLEYRGYDSAGIALKVNDELKFYKENGKITNLEEKVKDINLKASYGIGHTRWATHGVPSVVNAHPHFNTNKTIAVIHNGIIENYNEIKNNLINEGYKFVSETDSEVVAHLLDKNYSGDPEDAIIKTISALKGSFSLVIAFSDIDDTIYATKKDNPIIIGIGNDENFIASDIPAILEYTKEILIMNDGELATITKNAVKVFDKERNEIKKEITKIDLDIKAAEKEGYAHYMLKEIYEQPKVSRDVLYERISKENDNIKLENINIDINKYDKIYFVGCGTAYHAALIGKYLIEKIIRIPIFAEVASEFRYRDPIIDEKTLVIAVSQSGETADTLAAIRLSNERKATTLGIVNVIGSTIERECNFILHTCAGPEIAVASTKAYTTQVICMYLLTLYLGINSNKITIEEFKEYKKEILNISKYIEEILKQNEKIKEITTKYVNSKNVFFIGRGMDYYVAKEGSLKLKEIAYIHSEAYEAGELKHGPIALMEDKSLVVGIALNEELIDKLKSNLKEVKARGAKVVLITSEGNDVSDVSDDVVYIPKTSFLITSVLANVVQQLFAYHMAVLLGNDVDKPRNLAKSVTVE